MKRGKILEQITRHANALAWRVSQLARSSQFTSEELLTDIATEARRWLMRKKWGPPGPATKTHQKPPGDKK